MSTRAGCKLLFPSGASDPSVPKKHFKKKSNNKKNPNPRNTQPGHALLKARLEVTVDPRGGGGGGVGLTRRYAGGRTGRYPQPLTFPLPPTGEGGRVPRPAPPHSTPLRRAASPRPPLQRDGAGKFEARRPPWRSARAPAAPTTSSCATSCPSCGSAGCP